MVPNYAPDLPTRPALISYKCGRTRLTNALLFDDDNLSSRRLKETVVSLIRTDCPSTRVTGCEPGVPPPWFARRISVRQKRREEKGPGESHQSDDSWHIPTALRAQAAGQCKPTRSDRVHAWRETFHGWHHSTSSVTFHTQETYQPSSGGERMHSAAHKHTHGNYKLLAELPQSLSLKRKQFMLPFIFDFYPSFLSLRRLFFINGSYGWQALTRCFITSIRWPARWSSQRRVHSRV